MTAQEEKKIKDAESATGRKFTDLICHVDRLNPPANYPDMKPGTMVVKI